MELISPTINQHDSSVRVRNGHTVWLDGNAELDPYGFLEIGEINALGFGSATRGSNAGKPFNVAALERIAKRHRAIEVLDLRGTDVSPAGLSYLETLPNLRWLFVDVAHCDAVGTRAILKLTKLKRLMVDGDLTAVTADSIRKSLDACVLQTRANQVSDAILTSGNN